MDEGVVGGYPVLQRVNAAVQVQVKHHDEVEDLVELQPLFLPAEDAAGDGRRLRINLGRGERLAARRFCFEIAILGDDQVSVDVVFLVVVRRRIVVAGPTPH